MRNTQALAVMVKAPVAGFVKTRLVPPLSYAEAAGLYRCFIRDIFGNAARLKGVDVYAAYSPDEMKDEFSGLIPRGVGFFPQEGADLGERMYGVFEHLFLKGYGKAVIIGSDSPDLPAGFIDEAFRLLDGRNVDLVLGPAEDGGYYLVGMSSLSKAIFTGIPWSTEEVLKETLRKAKERLLLYKLLKPWHDIDRASDLELLKDNKGAPESSGFLKKLATGARS